MKSGRDEVKSTEKNKTKLFLDKFLVGYLRKLILAMYAERLLPEKIQRIVSLNPSAILIDNMAPIYRAIIFHAYNIKVFTLQTKVLSTRADAIPPACSCLIPSNNYLSKIYIHYLWKKHSIGRSLNNFWRKIIFLGKDDYSIALRAAKKYRFNLHEIERQRTFNYGFKNIPEIILSPQAFDFPRLVEPNKIYAGFGVDAKRLDTLDSEQYNRLKKIFLDNEKPLVYCSLGTLSTVHYKGSRLFLKKVIRSFQDQPITLIVATGTKINANQFHFTPPNVHIYQTVPQLEVLKHADVMITHGGMNSIKECILNEVPMVVYPLNNKWDQPGNSARVVYHGLGLRGNIRSESYKKIIQKVMHLLTNDSYKQNLKTMKQKVLKEDKHIEVADMIDAMINQSRLLKQSA